MLNIYKRESIELYQETGSFLKFQRLSWVLGFITGFQILDKRQLCNESLEAKFTLQRDTTNDRVTIVIEEARLYPPSSFFFWITLLFSPLSSSNHDKSMIKEGRKKKKNRKKS